MKKIVLLLVLVVALLNCTNARADGPPPSPTDAIYDTIQAILQVNSKYAGEGNKAMRRLKLREIIVPKFNFPEIAKRCLGSGWSMATPEEQTEFVEVFSEILIRTYLAKIETLKLGMVNIKSAKVNLPDAVVKTVTELQDEQVSIDYRMTLENSGWRVYDVVIENVSIVANYRNEFLGIIRKDHMSGLIEQLRRKLKTKFLKV